MDVLLFPSEEYALTSNVELRSMGCEILFRSSSMIPISLFMMMPSFY